MVLVHFSPEKRNTVDEGTSAAAGLNSVKIKKGEENQGSLGREIFEYLGM